MARGWGATARGRTGFSFTTTPCTFRSSSPARSTSCTGVRVDSQVSLVDVFPTVLALAGVDSTRQGPGAVASSPDVQARVARRDVYAYAESMPPSLQYGWSALHSLRSPRYKFIQAPRPELYDLATDPGEATNVFAQHRALAGDMARELERLMSDTSKDAPAPEAANLDKETLERLASLGYVGTSTPAKGRAALGSAAGRSQGQARGLHRRAARRRADGQ